MSIDPNLVIKTKTRNGRTPFHTACLHGHLRIVQLLLKYSCGEILNTKDSCGSTPLMEAVVANHLDIIKFLIENYSCIVDIYDRDNLENSCLHLSAQSGSVNAFKYLFDLFFKKQDDLVCEFSKLLNKFLMTPLHSAVKVSC